MPFDPTRAKAFMQSLSPKEIEEVNRRQQAEYTQQLIDFRAAYTDGNCYLCGKPFDQMRSSHPCTHWLLRRCHFKKNDLLKVSERYDYHNIATFLRWCANEEVLLRNINDLSNEKSDRKVISYTIKWKNIEWTFDCTKNDLHGHGIGHSSFPHYHFQMRIDGREFINFNDFHIPFSPNDLFLLGIRDIPTAHYNFGAAGSGMQEAVSVDPDIVLEHAVPTLNGNEAIYQLSTMIEATDQPLSEEELHEILEEARRTDKTFASVVNQQLQGRANIRTIISPSDTIPDIAHRTTHKPR